MKIFDCFTFFNELDILEIRLNELNDCVDHFVLVESSVTHSGKEKSFLFEENRERFSKFLDKIIHIKVADMPSGSDAWKRENFQRNAILRGLTNAAPDDLVIISDVDEIPRASVIADIAARKTGDVFALRMRFFTLRLNYMLVGGPATHHAWTVVLPFRRLVSPQELRNDVITLNANKATQNGMIAVDEGGWHYSSIGDDDHVKKKIAAYAHQESNNSSVLDKIDVFGSLSKGLDFFGRPEYFWSIVPLSAACPQFVVDNPDRYGHLISTEVPFDSVLSKAVIGASRRHMASLPRNIFERAMFKLFRRPTF